GSAVSLVVSSGQAQVVVPDVVGLRTTWALTGAMNSPRDSHTATLLPDGNVLVAGGHDGTSYVSSAEVSDTPSGVFTFTASSMLTARGEHTATLLPTGKVLIAGGFNGSHSCCPSDVLAAAELYDATTRTFTTTNSMGTARTAHTATLLAPGKVLVVGGVANG